ncbi:MAG: alpha/beta hydrolase [Oculatellaceae cyanobacterium bins.114]|nr:alpha/beta hydrolase [Oculatellaceae cyanobacterium bins.114]
MLHRKQIITLTPDHPDYHAAYSECGTGAPLLFLHGFMGEGGCWQSIVSDLAADYRCIALDMLGFGDSSKPMIRYDIAQLVAFVRQFVLTLGLERVTLVGHSLGAWVAAAYALAYDDVAGLVLVAPAGIRDDSFCGRYDHLRPLLWQTPVVDWGLWLMQPLASFMGQRQNLDRLCGFRREINAQPAGRSFLVDRLRPEDAIDTVEKQIHQLRVLTLVVIGDRDETIPLWHAQTYATEIAGAQLVVLPNADHSLPELYEAGVVEAMRPFLTEVIDSRRQTLFDVSSH